jgi:flagellar M-ring protein FliF
MFSDQAKLESEAELKLAQLKLKSSEEFEREKIIKEINEYTDKNPEEAARLLKAWLSVEE